MPKGPLRILGINPGTRYMGIALFEGSELKDWGVKVFKGKWSNKKMDRIIDILSGIIWYHKANVLCIKKLHPSRSSSNLKKLAKEIIKLSEQKGLKICRYSLEDLEGFFSCGERSTRNKLAAVVAHQYPELLNELESERKHKNIYHLRMFEAVALGSICFHQLDKPCRKTT